MVQLLKSPSDFGQLRGLYSILQKSVAKSRVLKNAIDSRMRIKTITYSDVLAKALPVLLARTFAHRDRPAITLLGLILLFTVRRFA